MLGSSEFHGGSCPSPLPQCPEGYILVEGDSWGEALSTASDQDIKSCAALCTDLPGECCSFEWSPTERQCNLNRECAPSHEKFQDYLFCVKGAVLHNLLTHNCQTHRFYICHDLTYDKTTGYMCHDWTLKEQSQVDSSSEKDVCESLGLISTDGLFLIIIIFFNWRFFYFS